MLKKIFLSIGLGLALPFAVLAAPPYILQQTILPITTNTYELGTSTQRWLNIFGNHGIFQDIKDAGLATPGGAFLAIDPSGNIIATSTPSGGGTGTVTSVALTTPTGLSIAGSPVTTSGTLALSLTSGYVIPLTASTTDWNTAYLNRITSATLPLSITSNVISISQSGVATNGYLSSIDWNTFNNKQISGNYITALTGDATASGPGSAVLSLATVASAGTTGSSTAIPVVTINAKGLTTGITTAAVIAPAGTLTGATLASNVLSSSLTSVGTLSSGAVPASLVTSGTFGVGDYVFPGNLITTGNSTTTNATSTNAFATKTTSGTFYSGGLTNCNGGNNALLWAGGTFGCTTITSGSGNVSTSSVPTIGNLAYWTGNGTPSTLGNVATTSLGASTGILFSGTLGSQVGGAGGSFSLDQSLGAIWTAASSTYVGGLTINTATSTQATTTSLSVSGNASTTSLYGSGLFACNGASNALTWNAGKFGCNTITGGGGSASSTLLSDNNGFTGIDTFTDLIATRATSTNATTTGNLAFGSNTTFTGLNSNTANSLDFWTNGVWRGGFSSAGSLGLGTTTPPSRLTIATTTLVNASTPLALLIGNRGLVSGAANGTIFGMNTDAGFTGNLLDIQTNGTDEMNLSSNGALFTSGGVQTNGNVQGASLVATGAGIVGVSGSTRFSAPSDGVMRLTNAAANDFTRLDFGGTSNLYPAFGVATNTNPAIFTTLADGTAGGRFGIATTTVPAYLTIGRDATTTAGGGGSNWGVLHLGNRGLTSGSANGTFVGINASSSFAGNFADFQVNGASKFSVASDGTVSAASNIFSSSNIQATSNLTAGANLQVGAGNAIFFNGGTRFAAPADGILLLSKNAAGDMTRVDFGNTSNLFPAFSISTSTAKGIGALLTLADGTAGGIFGIGTTTALTAALAVQSNSSTLDLFALATTSGKTVEGVDSAGHNYTSGTAPVVSSCGTGSPSVVGDDKGGTITTGTAATACTLTFNIPYTNTPYVQGLSDNSATIVPSVSAISTTAVTFSLGAGLSGGSVYYSFAYHR